MPHQFQGQFQLEQRPQPRKYKNRSIRGAQLTVSKLAGNQRHRVYGKVFHDSTDSLRTARARQSIHGWHTETPSEYRDCKNKKRDHNNQWVATRSKCHEDRLTEGTKGYQGSEVRSWGLRVIRSEKLE